MRRKSAQTTLSVRVPSALAERVDAFASSHGHRNRTEALRSLIESGLNAPQGGDPIPPAPVASLREPSEIDRSVAEASAAMVKLKAIERLVREHAIANHAAMRAILGGQLNGATERARLAAREFIDSAFTEFSKKK